MEKDNTERVGGSSWAREIARLRELQRKIAKRREPEVIPNPSPRAWTLDESEAFRRGLYDEGQQAGRREMQEAVTQGAREIRRLEKALAEAQQEIARLTARAVVAEQHKVLDRLGKSSYQEVVEDKLRTELAETQVRVEELQAEIASLRAQIHAAGKEAVARWLDWHDMSEAAERVRANDCRCQECVVPPVNE